MLKTMAELSNWRDDCEEMSGGDPAASCGNAFFRYARVLGAGFDDLIASDEGDDLVLRINQGELPVRVSISRDGPRLTSNGELVSFGLVRIAAGIWTLNPSLNIPGLLHVFVTIYAVPDPAPWERPSVIITDAA